MTAEQAAKKRNLEMEMMMKMSTGELQQQVDSFNEKRSNLLNNDCYNINSEKLKKAMNVHTDRVVDMFESKKAEFNDQIEEEDENRYSNPESEQKFRDGKSRTRKQIKPTFRYNDEYLD